MTNPEYFSKPGLSNSGMKDLMISPLRYWWKNVRPDREPEEPTAEMTFGSALHCAVLESEREFDKRYACEVNPDDYPGALKTVPEIKAWCAEKNSPCKAKDLKDDAIKHALSIDPNVQILHEIEKRHWAENQGKTILPLDNWLLLAGAARALKSEPRVQEILSKGEAEVPLFVKCPDTGVPLKAKIDWLHPDLIAEFKTYTQQRGKSINKTISDAIFYEGYYRQAYFYSMVRALAEGTTWAKRKSEVVFPFVESVPPHEVRLKVLRPKFAGNVNLFWERARVEVQECIRTYAEYMDKFGVEKPWRYAQDIDPLQDEEIPALSYAA